MSNRKKNASKEILIAGAGLTGSLLAIMLGRRGYRVRVCEKRPDPRLHRMSAGRSINLAISARGIRALEHAGVKERIMADAIPMQGRMIHGLEGTLSFQPYGFGDDDHINAISRADLNGHLMTAAEEMENVKILHNQRAVAYEPQLGAVEFVNESTGGREKHTADIVIGADGFSSVIRDGLLKKNGGTAAVDSMNHGYKELYIAAGAEGAYKMERNALHIWPRGSFMMIALPNPGGSFTVTLFMENEKFAEVTSARTVIEFFSLHFPDSLPLLDDLERSFLDHPVGTLGSLRCGAWHYSSGSGAQGLILGDAAHAIVPFYGQGMNACFEDCVILNQLLEQSGDDWEACLPEFYRVRKPNADAIAELALANYVEMRDLTGRDDFQRMKHMERRLVSLFPGRYLPVYGMVSFTHLPYSVAWGSKRLQDRFLADLIQDHPDPDQATAEGLRAPLERYLEGFQGLLEESERAGMFIGLHADARMQGMETRSGRGTASARDGGHVAGIVAD